MNFYKERCRMKLTTADWSGFCRILAEKNVFLYDIEGDGCLSFTFSIRRHDKKIVTAVCEKRGDHLTVLKSGGISTAFLKFFHRPVLAAGLLALIFLFLFLPTRVLFIRVSGNETIPERKILEAAEQCGIRFGSSRKQLRSEQIKNELLQKIPGISWAGVNTRGCTAEISVKELKTDSKKEEFSGAASIVAERDGIIESCTVRAGELMCSKGQAVRQGETLISGCRELENRVQITQADGEIFAVTAREQTTVTPSEYLLRGEIQFTSRTISLLLGKKRIKIFGNSGNQNAVCGRMYEEYYITLPGGYRLPAALAVDTRTEGKTGLREKHPELVQKNLGFWAQYCLQQEMIAGKVLEKHEKLEKTEGLYRLRGSYLCHEMIGRLRQEKIGVKQDTWKES